jgi:hypothetical protein
MTTRADYTIVTDGCVTEYNDLHDKAHEAGCLSATLESTGTGRYTLDLAPTHSEGISYISFNFTGAQNDSIGRLIYGLGVEGFYIQTTIKKVAEYTYNLLIHRSEIGAGSETLLTMDNYYTEEQYLDLKISKLSGILHISISYDGKENTMSDKEWNTLYSDADTTEYLGKTVFEVFGATSPGYVYIDNLVICARHVR